MRVTGMISIVLSCELAARDVEAQEELHHWTGQYPGEQFGSALSNAGDIDLNGVEDVMVGSPLLGVVYWYSGSSGAVLRQLAGERDRDKFGVALSCCSDLDGDGVAEHFIGAPFAGSYTGRAYLYDGFSGASIAVFTGENSSDEFGRAVADVGDVDADGVSDLGVGAPWFDSRGAVYVYSGKTQQLLWRLVPPGYLEKFGAAVSSLDDVDGDGHADVLIGAPSGSGWGRAYVYSGRTGSVLKVFDPGRDLTFFGSAVDELDDLDRDGTRDLIVGAQWMEQAVVYSGATGNPLRTYSGSGCFGCSVAGVEDVNADGFEDFLVGELSSFVGGQHSVGEAFLYSGATLELMYTFQGYNKGDSLGFPVSSAGDFNVDGIPDLLIGATAFDTSSTRVGRVYVFSGLHLPGLQSVNPRRTRYDLPAPVIVRGSHLSTNASINLCFGGVPASVFMILDDQSVACKAPPHATGPVDVTFSSPVGSTVLADGFVYTPALLMGGAPSSARSLTLRLLLESGDDALVLLGIPPPVSVPTPPFDGALCILPFFRWQTIVDAPGREVRLDLIVPRDASLAGLSLLVQALAGPQLSGPGRSGSWTNCLEVVLP